MSKYFDRWFGPKMSMRRQISGGLMLFAGVSVWIFCLYPAVVRPLIMPEEYRKRQLYIEQGLHKHHPPGGLREWSNPFEERTKQEPLFLQKAREEKEKETPSP